MQNFVTATTRPEGRRPPKVGVAGSSAAQSKFGESLRREPRFISLRKPPRHLAVTSHGRLDPATLPGEFRRPTVSGACGCWWVAIFDGLLPPPPAGAGGPFALSAPGNLEAFVELVGLEPQRADEVAVDFVFATLDDAVRAHLAAGPGRRAIEHAGHDAAADTIRASLESSVQPDGTSVHRNAFRYLIASA